MNKQLIYKQIISIKSRLKIESNKIMIQALKYELKSLVNELNNSEYDMYLKFN